MSLVRTAMMASLLVGSAQAAEVVVKLNHLNANSLRQAGFVIKEALVPSLGIYLLSDSQKSVTASLANAKSLQSVKAVMANKKMSLRSIQRTPSDASWAQQWGPQKIGAPAAWDLGTGGRNSDNDDIVVAVVDNGTDINHDDLKSNIWVNAGEIPRNGKDDDGNGYIDDVNGWNAYNSNANIPAGMHGTHVSGIVGAEGDNAKQVTGVNWDVKIMPVAASSGDTAVVLRGYNYVLEQKKAWLNSGGEKGANVVSTNSSFGVDAANCDEQEYQVWNDVYEAMGKVGILSAAATANQAWDIDNVGDVPTSCKSEYIIAVTNTTRDDKIYRQAGWGRTQVDLGAPGTDVLSTVPGNQVRNLTGTSMATPHVAGAVALLHSVASARFTTLTKSDPAQAALELKRIMLSTVDPIADLQGKTVSGGRLNLQKAAQAISRY